MSVNGVLQAIGTAATAAFVAIAFTALPERLAATSAVEPRIEPADAIVVLGAYALPEGRLSATSLQRTVRGVTLARSGLAPLVVFLGGAPAQGARAEADIRAELALALGIEPAAMLTETRGLTTRGEAEVVRERLAPRGVERILLVSDGLHLARAVPLFVAAGFDVDPVPADDFSMFPTGPMGRLLLMRRVLEEQMARLYYRAAGYL